MASGKQATAHGLISKFLAGNGSDDSFEALRNDLRGLGLSKAEREELAESVLPGDPATTTGQKLCRVDRFLDRLAAQ